MCVLLNTLSIPCSSHRMSDGKTFPSSGAPEGDSSAPEASGSSPATVANMRTLQDVERAIKENNATHIRVGETYATAIAAYLAAQAASKRDPTNKVLSDELADAKETRDACKSLIAAIEQGLATLQSERAQLRAAATASSSEQKSEFLFYVHSTLCLCIVRVQSTVYVSGCYSTLQRPLCCLLDNPSYCWHIKTVVFASLTTYTQISLLLCRWLAWTYTSKSGYYRSLSFHAVPVCS